jgi:hypothetical protein
MMRYEDMGISNSALLSIRLQTDMQDLRLTDVNYLPFESAY